MFQSHSQRFYSNLHIIWATNKAVLFIMVPVLCVSGGVGACPARVTVLGLCVCVCQQLFWHYVLRGGLSAIPTAAVLREPEKSKSDSAEATTFESEKLARSWTELHGPTHQLAVRMRIL